MGMKRLTIALFLVMVLVLAACERQASPSIPDTGQQGAGEQPTSETPFPPLGILETAAAATQTAQVQPALPAVQETEAVEVTPTEAQQIATATEVPPEPTAVPEATQEPTPVVVTDCASPYVVSEGEWVYSIARKCGLDPDAIIATNALAFPYLLYPGDELALPAASGNAPPPESGATCASPYTVQLGDWVYSIARKCGVTAEAIISANSLAFPYTIFPGDQLNLP